MRRLSAIGLVAASGVVLVSSWRIGDAARSSTSSAAQVVGPAQAQTSTDPPTGSSSSTKSAHPKSARSKPSSSKSSSSSTSGPPTQQVVNGAVIRTQYGDVQVRIVLSGSHLVDVTALHLTDSSSRSVSISAQAAPILRREALAAGSAKIDTVSGASYTSQGYIQSLQSALDAARAAA